ncbi:MAG TPA: SDR family oxidoreductase [Alloiococcus sp.]|nr:SDR family oxidoreductase [Alloiococcus sp.]
MTNKKDPTQMYYTDDFPKQNQPYPPLESKMTPKPDCGEEHYEGTNQLEGKKILVTGGDSGIGRAAVIAFAREGADVAVNYLPDEQEDAEQVKAYIENAGQKAVLIPGDLKDDEFNKSMVQTAVEELGGLDVLVLNAGEQFAVDDILDLEMEQVRNTFNANVISMFQTVKEALPHLEAGASIITTTSVQAYSPSPHLLDYAATKFAINGFTRGLAKQLGPKGIRVNSVAPGPIWTSLQLAGGQPEEALPEFGQDVPLGRAGQPVELAPVYVFLASDKASYVTAQTYGITGGTELA